MRNALLLLCLLPFAALADVNLKWDLSSPPTDIKANAIYCAITPTGPWTLVATTPGGANNTGTVPACGTDTVYFTVRAVNYVNIESANSNVAAVTVSPLSPPVVQACPIPEVVYIVSSISGRTDRPLYSDSFTSIGRVEFLKDGQTRICEPDPVIKPGTTTQYRHVTNNAGQRGLTICKEKK